MCPIGLIGVLGVLLAAGLLLVTFTDHVIRNLPVTLVLLGTAIVMMHMVSKASKRRIKRHEVLSRNYFA